MNKVYEVITNRIIEKVTNGAKLPWVKPWKPGDAPHNLSGRGYTGMNVFLLDMEKEEKGYTSNTWLTFNQATNAGADVTGQHTTPVIFCKVFYNEADEKKFSMRYYNVFNADQCKGLVLPAEKPAEEINPIEAAEMIVLNMPNRPANRPYCPCISHRRNAGGGNNADAPRLKPRKYNSTRVFYCGRERKPEAMTTAGTLILIVLLLLAAYDMIKTHKERNN